MTRHWWHLAWWWVWLLMAATAPGQQPPRLPEKPEPTVIPSLPAAARNQWERAETLLQQGLTEEARDTYRRVMDGYGDSLVRWPTIPEAEPVGFERFRPLRELGWLRLATLRSSSPAVFAALRRQMDPQARRWFEDASKDPGAFDERIVDELFLSSYTDEALLRLGDAALERGEYNVARRHWERIAMPLRFPPVLEGPLQGARHRPFWLPLVNVDWEGAWPLVAPLLQQPGEPSELTYPDSNVPIADVRARLVLASILEGDFDRSAIEVEILRRTAPDAVGTLAGRSGPWVELLGEFQRQAVSWASPKADANWPTLGGSAARNRVAPAIQVKDEAPLWSVPLPRWEAGSEWLSGHRARVAEDADLLLPYHPVVSEGMVVVQTEPRREGVKAYRLRTGEPTLPEIEPLPRSTPAANLPELVGVPRFPLSADRERLFLLAGWPELGDTERPAADAARLQAIDVVAERRLLWELTVPAVDRGQELSIAGPATSDGTQAYIILRRREAARVESYLVALDIRDGRVVWKRVLGASESAVDTRWRERTYHFVTVDQGTVYCHTSQGFVAAVDARTGRVRWLTTYPRSGWRSDLPDANHLHAFRDLTPCLVHHDILVVAPADSNRLFALDATTGIPLWVAPAEVAADAIHLLGVVDHRLVVSGECVYWFDIRSGSLLGRYAEPFKAAPGFARPVPRGYGRGILAGHHLYWPTPDAILVFDLESPGSREWRPHVTRQIPLAPHGAVGGNLVWSDGVLLVASAERLLALEAPATR